MSREIKFRAWIERNKEMITPYFFVNSENFITQYGSSKPSQVMQFTGLKDENGVELFDGDIYVQWGRVCKCDFEHNIYEKMSSLIFDGDFEVIGNIYENPELLEESK